MKVPVQILFVFRWCQIGHTVVHHYVSVFGMLAHWKPKYRRYVIFCYLVVLTISLWLNRGLPRTIVLPLPTSRIRLKVYHLPRSTCRGGLAVIARKGLRISRNKGCILSSFKHFDLTITSGDKVYKNGFTVERFSSELSAFLEELTVTSCQFLVCGNFNFHVNDNSNANPKEFSDFLFSADLSSPIQAHWERTLELVVEMWKSLLCCEMRPNVGGNCTGTLWP